MSLSGTSGIEMRIGDDARDVSPMVDEFLWTESLIDGGFTWALKLKTLVWREWWNLMLGRDRPVIRFRLKQQESGIESSTGWKRAITDWSKAGFSATATMDLEIHGADRRLDLLQRARTRTFSNETVAGVVRRIGQEHGLRVNDVAETRGERIRWQFRQSDWTFMRSLMRGAASRDGRGDPFLYMEEDDLRLVVVQSQAASARRHDTASVENRLNDYIVQYHGRQIDRMGGATFQGVGFDFGAKTGITVAADESVARVHPALSKRVPRQQSDGLRVAAVMETGQELVDAVTRARWGDLAPRYFSIRLNTRPDLTLKPNAVVEIVATDHPDRESVVQGRYLLLEVQHRYLNGAISTTAVGFRREAWEGAGQPTGAAADNVRTRDRFRSGAAAPPTTVIVAQVLS